MSRARAHSMEYWHRIPLPFVRHTYKLPAPRDKLNRPSLQGASAAMYKDLAQHLTSLSLFLSPMLLRQLIKKNSTSAADIPQYKRRAGKKATTRPSIRQRRQTSTTIIISHTPPKEKKNHNTRARTPQIMDGPLCSSEARGCDSKAVRADVRTAVGMLSSLFISRHYNLVIANHSVSHHS